MKKKTVISNLKRLVKVPIIIIDSDESVASSTKGDLVGAVVPPVVDASVASCVPEGDHCGDLAPAVLTDPAVAAGAVLAKMNGKNGFSGNRELYT